MIRIFLVTLTIFSFIISSCRKPQNGDGEIVKNKVRVDGRNRSYYVYYPDNLNPDLTYPAILVLHGRFGNGKNMQSLSHFNLIADELGIIIIYPEGVRKSWNDGRGEDAGPASKKEIDDVAFISKLIDQSVSEHHVHQDSIYAAGMSNGGFMTLRLACELNNKIAAFGSVTGAMGKELFSNCNPGKEVPVMLIAGIDDELVNYSGGLMDHNDTEIEGFETIFDYWGTNNGCSFSQIDTLSDTVDDGTVVHKLYYQNCSKEVILYKIIGGGHTWPSGDEYLNEDRVGITSQEINASRELAVFFLKFSL